LEPLPQPPKRIPVVRNVIDAAIAASLNIAVFTVSPIPIRFMQLGAFVRGYW
jgi:hypothetical protein